MGMEDKQNDPRLDPIGTVRKDSKGRQAVKVSMGDDSGKGQHVWVHTDDHLNHRWFHHVEVGSWTVVQPQAIADFCAARADYIEAINNCHPDNDRDYWRWQGHAESRRQLSERLGLPTAWPAEVAS